MRERLRARPTFGLGSSLLTAALLLAATPLHAQDAGTSEGVADADLGDGGAADAGPVDGDLSLDGDVESAEPEPDPIPTERLPQVAATLERDEVELGETIRLSIAVSYQPRDRVHLRDRSRLGELEILRSQRTEGVEEGGPSEIIELELICFEVGDIEIPAVELMVVLSDQRTGSVETEPLSVRVTDPLANEHEPQARPDHAPRTVYTTDRRAIWAGAIIGGLLLAVLLGLALERWRSRRKPKPGPPPPPPRPPEEVAFEKLEAARRSGMLEEGEVKAFHIVISEAVREYLGGRYGFDSLEMTTKQLVLELDQSTLRGITRVELHEFLRETDMVKFAKWRPDQEQSRELMEQAYDIVRRTTAAERACRTVVEPRPEAKGAPPDEKKPEPTEGATTGGSDGA